MLYKVEKDGQIQSINNDLDLSAYLNNGWKLQGEGVEKTTPITPSPIKKEVEEVSYTKTDINRMSLEDLQKLAKGKDIEVKGKSGGELKKALIEKLGL